MHFPIFPETKAKKIKLLLPVCVKFSHSSLIYQHWVSLLSAHMLPFVSALLWLAYKY